MGSTFLGYVEGNRVNEGVASDEAKSLMKSIDTEDIQAIAVAIDALISSKVSSPYRVFKGILEVELHKKSIEFSKKIIDLMLGETVEGVKLTSPLIEEEKLKNHSHSNILSGFLFNLTSTYKDYYEKLDYLFKKGFRLSEDGLLKDYGVSGFHKIMNRIGEEGTRILKKYGIDLKELDNKHEGEHGRKDKEFQEKKKKVLNILNSKKPDLSSLGYGPDKLDYKKLIPQLNLSQSELDTGLMNILNSLGVNNYHQVLMDDMDAVEVLIKAGAKLDKSKLDATAKEHIEHERYLKKLLNY